MLSFIMSGSFQRIHWLYRRLKENAYPSRHTYYDEFGRSRSTFKRDLDLLRNGLDAPVEYDQEQDGYFLTDHSFELPSYWFDRSHLLLLIGLCRHLRQTSGFHADLDRLTEKLRSLLTLADGTDITTLFSFELVEWSRCNSHHFDAVSQALLTRSCLDIQYHAARNDTCTHRCIEPYRLHNYMGTWYLVAWCKKRESPRLFSLARIQQADILDKRWQTTRFDVDAYLNDAFGIFKGKAVAEVVLRFDSSMARFIRSEVWHPDQKMLDEPDGGLRLTLPVANFTEITMRVLKYGHHVEVLAPMELRQQVADAIRKMAAVYSDDWK